MNGLSLRDPHFVGTLAAAGLCLGGLALYVATRKRTTAEELERIRRQDLVLGGRIIDGTILDIAELDETECGRPGGMQLILYKYEIAGVSYECSQDVTNLKEVIRIEEIRVGFPCSVRYDTRQPENSIIVAENWMGLRDTANSVPVRRAGRRRWSAPVG
ncbi:MAG TPA: hypothetical protein VGD62_12280 [Acidobacteriaceae bacterium]